MLKLIRQRWINFPHTSGTTQSLAQKCDYWSCSRKKENEVAQDVK